MKQVFSLAAVVFLGLSVLFVLSRMLSSGTETVGSGSSETAEKYGEGGLSEKTSNILSVIGTPEISVSYVETGNTYRYNVHLAATLETDSTDEFIFLPVLLYKNARNRDAKSSEITMGKGIKPVELDFDITSSEPPIILRNNDKSFEGNILDKQILFLKNFSFKVAMEQFGIDFINLGRCKAVIYAQCPFENSFTKLSLGDENKGCINQKNTEDCRKDLDMCGTTASIELLKLTTDESIIGKLLPGSPDCSAKIPSLSIKVGDAQKSRFAWKVGEDLTVFFWKKSSEKELADCWKGTATAKEACLSLLLGGSTITIPPESYEKQK